MRRPALDFPMARVAELHSQNSNAGGILVFIHIVAILEHRNDFRKRELRYAHGGRILVVTPEYVAEFA